MAYINKINKNDANYDIQDARIPEVTVGANVGEAVIVKNDGSFDFGKVDSLPEQSGKSGKFLTTNGSSANWATVPTYSSKSAASEGTDVSLVTTGEKYSWNNKGNAMAAKGSATRPVYISSTDVATACTYGFGVDSTGPYIESF